MITENENVQEVFLNDRTVVFATKAHPAPNVKEGDELIVGASTVDYLIDKGFVTIKKVTSKKDATVTA
jgi:hypothetical protein